LNYAGLRRRSERYSLVSTKSRGEELTLGHLSGAGLVCNIGLFRRGRHSQAH
jgi:hypothetical protein